MKINKPIFILCIHRSGSTLLNNVLNNNSMVAMAIDEMHLAVPYYRTFYDQFKSYDLSKEYDVNKICDLVMSGNIRGSFWKKINRYNFKIDEIREIVKRSNGSFTDFIKKIFDHIITKEKKERIGVKYPVHFSKINILKKWFPDSKIIFLVRDIRAIIVSKVNDEATIRRKKKFRLFGFLIQYLTMFVFILDFIWYVNIILKNKNNGLVIKYEDLCKNPGHVILKICSYCEIPFEKKMLIACGKPSSFDGITFSGFDYKRTVKWREKIKRHDLKIINLICKVSLEKLGYKIV